MDKGLKLYILIITAFLLCSVGVAHGFAESGQESPMGRVADFFFPPVQSMFTTVRNKTADWFSDITSAKQYRTENTQLKETVARMKSEERETAALRKENERLKQLLELKQETTEYDAVACHVIAGDAHGVSGVFRIDKGKKQGVEKYNAVIHSGGLVGRVTAVYENSACVTPVMQAGSAAGARIVRSQGMGVAEYQENRLMFSSFSEEAMPVVGDEVETSGTGGIYPAGLLIGMVSAVTPDGAEITPSVRMESIREVLVLCKKDKGDGDGKSGQEGQ